MRRTRRRGVASGPLYWMRGRSLLRARLALAEGGGDQLFLLGEVLVEIPDRGRGGRRTTGHSTASDVLETLRDRHPIADCVLRYRELAKLKSTYADALVGMVSPKTGRVHTSFNQTVTATGRLSSSDPNLQNIPVRTPAGHVLTREAPPDHPWHHALWFTIKFVDGDNFWEEYDAFGTLVHDEPPSVAEDDDGRVVVRGALRWVRPDGATVSSRSRGVPKRAEV